LKGPETAEPVMKLVDEYNGLPGLDYDQILVSSFNRRELIKARHLTPDIPIGVLVRGIPRDDAAFAEDLGAVSVHAGLSFVHRAFVDDAHRRGLKVFVYTVNHRDDLKRMRAMGVDGVFTNYPDLALLGNR
jgi:glycerophosphoryl diester phosphodiesterase